MSKLTQTNWKSRLPHPSELLCPRLDCSTTAWFPCLSKNKLSFETNDVVQLLFYKLEKQLCNLCEIYQNNQFVQNSLKFSESLQNPVQLSVWSLILHPFFKFLCEILFTLHFLRVRVLTRSCKFSHDPTRLCTKTCPFGVKSYFSVNLALPHVALYRSSKIVVSNLFLGSLHFLAWFFESLHAGSCLKTVKTICQSYLCSKSSLFLAIVYLFSICK